MTNHSMREATVAGKTKAEDVRKELEQVLGDTDPARGQPGVGESKGATQP